MDEVDPYQSQPRTTYASPPIFLRGMSLAAGLEVFMHATEG